jgi:hypothetical protein
MSDLSAHPVKHASQTKLARPPKSKAEIADRSPLLGTKVAGKAAMPGI